MSKKPRVSFSEAKKLANYLFSNGNREHAERLVLELPDKRDGGGWGEHAMAVAIYEFLNDRRPTKDDPNRE
jgi:hypothetical protein